MFSIYGDGGVQNVFTINYKIFLLTYATNHSCLVQFWAMGLLFLLALQGKKKNTY